MQLSNKTCIKTGIRLNDGSNIKLFILVGWCLSFFECCLAHRGSTVVSFFASVFQWCCSTPQGSPGVGHNTLFLSSPHLCFIIAFIRDLLVSHDNPLMSKKTFTQTEQLTTMYMF